MSSVVVQKNLIDFLIQNDKNSSVIEILIIGIGTLFIILFSQLSFSLPFSPVPITAQSLAILVMASSFGFKKAFVTTFSYVGAGAIGLPVFSGGKFGLTVLSGPTGGYIIGFIIAASIMGYYGDKGRDKEILSSILLFSIGHAIILFFGLLWLANFVSADRLLKAGFYPFIPGLILKTVLAGILTSALWKIAKKMK